MAKRHLTDATLIAWLDGELTVAERENTSRHLDHCWECRLRVQDLQEQITEVTRTFAAAAFQTPPMEESPLPPAVHPWRKWMLLGAVSAVLAASSFRIWSVPEDSPAPPIRIAKVAPQVKRFEPKAVAPPQLPIAPPLTAVMEIVAPSFPAPLNLDEVEVEARYALFRMQADLAEAIEVKPAADRVWVRGIVEPASRRDSLRAALEGIEGLRVELSPVEAIAATPVQTTAERIVAIAPPFEAEVKEYAASLAVPLTATEFRNRQIDRSLALADHAWALRRLEEAFPEERLKRLNHASRWLLEVMAQAHLTAMEEGIEELVRETKPLLARVGEAGSRHASAPGPLFEQVVEIQKLVTTLFAARAAENSLDPSRTAGRLLGALATPLSEIARCQDRWRQRAAVHP